MKIDSIPLIARAEGHGRRQALMTPAGAATYRDLLAASARVATVLLGSNRDLDEGRVALAIGPGFEYVAWQWGIWRAGGVAVPLCVSHPEPELSLAIEDADCATIVADREREAVLRPLAGRLGLRFLPAAGQRPPASGALPAVDSDRRAMIIYTSGTTSRPKGVVFTHRIIAAQIRTLVDAWAWRADDRIVNALPLHHIHGIVNVLGCALWAGATCELEPAFDPAAVWERFAAVSLFMAVPTIYVRLIRAWDEASAETRARWTASAAAPRLMVSGSAALPVPVLERWREITGQVLLERYGMTEIGMALSNPLDGERRAGAVGTPLPGVAVRLRGEDGSAPAAGEPGEIEVRGPGVFLEYWRSPAATAAAFRDGWFRTGDVAVFEDGYYRILGRASVDIIKTGGYKVSALEIEAALLEHPEVAECAVVGVADPEWGQRVAAAVVARPGPNLSGAELERWAKQRLAGYKVPRRWRLVESLPKNALGKVVKPAVAALFTSAAT